MKALFAIIGVAVVIAIATFFARPNIMGSAPELSPTGILPPLLAPLAPTLAREPEAAPATVPSFWQRPPPRGDFDPMLVMAMGDFSDEEIARYNRLNDVLAGLERLREVGFTGTKIDTVVMRGMNDDELVPLIEYGKFAGVEVRFIEYMDVGGATRWSSDTVVPRAEMLKGLTAHYGEIEPVVEESSAPADRFRLSDGTVFGIISSTTEPFCGSCDRSRITADGTWYHCFYASAGFSLREPLRRGASTEDLAGLLTELWEERTERGAEERLASADRSALHQREHLAGDPRLEMHTRGG